MSKPQHTQAQDTQAQDTQAQDTQAQDTNAAVWKSGHIAATWTAEAGNRERTHGTAWRLMASLLPFTGEHDVTFLDLGAGTGAASQAILARHPRASGILADFSAEMMAAGEAEMLQFAGRYRYVEFDLATAHWPAGIPPAVDAVVTSLSVHHLPDARKQGLFAEIHDRLVPGGWYLNYDPVRAEDPAVAAAWQQAADEADPEAAHKRLHRTADEQARYENHVRYIIPLRQQLDYLGNAGFRGIDVHWKRLDYVVYGGYRQR